ncbi:TIR domain-containing protein [Elizabethkingia anophelis]|uniref:TIR domain-containing protein n=1 Tax=Elizabethkingia anophelis TaxID=1117645 RepID=UPI0038920825
MNDFIIRIQNLLSSANELEYHIDGIKNSDKFLMRAKMIIGKVFGENSKYLQDFNKIFFYQRLLFSAQDTTERRNIFYSGKRHAINLLEVMIEDLQIDNIKIKVSKEQISDTVANKIYNVMENKKDNNKVFIVHGHNIAMKQEVARTLEKLSLEPIILHEQPDGGKTIIEKFTDNSNVGFAIVLLSADDVAHPKNSPNDTKKRARQNVILELGYFLGKLGREKVLSLYEENSDLEIPSDYMGVLFTPYDGHGSWKTKLAKELRHVGYKIDAEAIVNL